MIQKLTDRIDFDLDKGPYIIGSYVTHLLEGNFRDASWVYGDIDIICRTENQMQHLKVNLTPISDYYNEKERQVVSQMFDVHPLQMIWVIDGVTVTASIRDKPASEQIKTADYTISAAATDGTLVLASSDTISDIKDQVLRIQSFDFNRRCNRKDAAEWIMSKYKTYVSRGYADKNNLVLAELNSIVTAYM
jgi:hypothetical protein